MIFIFLKLFGVHYIGRTVAREGVLTELYSFGVLVVEIY